MKIKIEPRTDRADSSPLMKGLVDFAGSNDFVYDSFSDHFQKTGVDRSGASKILSSFFSHLSSFDDLSDLSFIKVSLENENSPPSIESEY
ncbi:hypothetical protein [Qipengyuania huizhouensis]|uniref:hypothetical protein n=1 Tax=Qipengyuania huizhouensis TaxID=2867245 RepID=UPI001C88AF24|nr:hypothetical protein [Qipengyuania huizhouensis]MBX7461513.1 hypothetical protein [Qipengyuania huizhouensis]